MGAREDDVKGGPTTSTAAERIEEDIDATRARLDSTVSALGERLTVRGLAGSAAHAALHGAGTASTAALRTIKDNPMPAALVGLGIAWFIMDKYRARSVPRATERGGNGDRDWLAPGATYTPGGGGHAPPGPSISQRAGRAAHAAADTVRSTAHRAREGFWKEYDNNPLMIGAAAFAIGLVGGLSVSTLR